MTESSGSGNSSFSICFIRHSIVLGVDIRCRLMSTERHLFFCSVRHAEEEEEGSMSIAGTCL